MKPVHIRKILAGAWSHMVLKRLDDQRERVWRAGELHNDETAITVARREAIDAFALLSRIRTGLYTNDDDDRRFQPSKDELYVLSTMFPALFATLRFQTLKDMHRILSPFLGMDEKADVGVLVDDSQEALHQFQNSVFWVQHKLNDNVNEFNDHMSRARYLVKLLQSSRALPGAGAESRGGDEPKKAYFLDGHDRMLLCILQAMEEVGIDPNQSAIELVCIDIDPEVHAWHESFFPTSVRCLHRDALEIGVASDLEVGPGDVVYLNFCSVPDRVTNVFFNKEEVLKHACRLSQMCHMMLSCVVPDMCPTHRTHDDRMTTGLQDVLQWVIKSKPATHRHLCGYGFEQLILGFRDDDFVELSKLSPDCPRRPEVSKQGLAGVEISRRESNHSRRFVTWYLPNFVQRQQSLNALFDGFESNATSSSGFASRDNLCFTKGDSSI